MRILLLGACGFIGRELAAALRARGHRIVAGVRKSRIARAFAADEAIEVDLERDLDPSAWARRLERVDAVVNCAGILQERRAGASERIHVHGPAALYRACEAAGLRRVVLISAISADPEAGTAYAKTKLAGEDALRATGLEWIVLRPSLVVARGAHGGSALLRALAALPAFVPVPGDGGQSFQPIRVEDLGTVTALALETDRLVHRTVTPVGPDVVTLREMLVDLRRWLGLPAARIVRIPRALVAMAARCGDLAGGTLNTTALRQLEHGNTGDASEFRRLTGVEAPGWRAILAAQPSHAQDRWHARLYFVRPVLRIAIAALWLVSGIAGLPAAASWAPSLAQASGIPAGAALALLLAACACDLAIGVLVLLRWRPVPLAGIQAAVVAVYTLFATLVAPDLWLDPFGPLVKNVPILAAIAALAAIEEER